MKKTVFFLFLLLTAAKAYPAVVTGRVTDEKNEPLPFASVYVEGTSRGTTTNTEGRYTLSLTSVQARLVFRLIGYKTATVWLQHVTDTVVNVQLRVEAYNLTEVNVKAEAEDPAYAIVRKAIERRKFHLSQVTEFTCDAYTKFLQKMDEYPDKFLGQDVDLSESLDTATGIIYLSESVSRLAYRYPDKVKEEMISSKVSGSRRAFSFNQASGLLFNFYENLLDLGEIGQRGFVSPVASNALFYYRYRYEGEFVENGVTVNKIRVLPKRMHDPVFQGTMYIQEDSWRIHSLDLFLTKASQLQFVDTITFHQVYVPVDSATWLPFSAQVDFVFNFLGFHGRGYFLGICSNYNIHPGFAKGTFDGEVLKVNREANRKDSVYWEQARQVPLTLEEKRDYEKKDSAIAVRESKPYRDSVDQKNNRFRPGGFLLGGYTFRRSFEKKSFSIAPLISSVQYNTVEGLNLDLGLVYRKGDEEEEGKNLRIESHLRYGFSNSHFNAWAGFRKRYNPPRLGRYGVTAGSEVVQFNRNNPISELINTGYTLFGEHNYMKIYESRFVRAFHESELTNGLLLRLASEWSSRLPLENTTDYAFVDKENRVFTSNDPQNPGTETMHFVKHEAFLMRASLFVTPGQEYISRPTGKYVLGTDWPTFALEYTGSVRFLGGDLSFHRLHASVEKELSLGLLGHTELKASGGDFLSKESIEFMDATHFQGNRTIFSGFGLEDYKLLSYYTFSTLGPYYAAHVEHNFGGFILNKIPLLRKLKLGEVAGLHYLHTDELGSYTEISFGLEKLGIFRVDFVSSFSSEKSPSVGFVFGIKGL